jgi:cbb3-type cytochrome c oxidase subunit III
MRRNKILLLVASLGTLALLAWAALFENVLADWRLVQREARARMPPDQAETFTIQLRQIVTPELRAADRCVSCHVGMAPGEQGVAGDRILGAHPEVVHDPASFGCTVCHAGQGRATTTAEAHGDVHFWPSPMVPRKYAYAGCGSCHTHLAVPNLTQLERGRALFERHDCLACHRVDRRGGTLRPGGEGGEEGPDLSRVGGVGWRPDWHEHHREAAAAATRGPWRAAFSELPPPDLRDLEVYLGSRVGAPGLVEAKALFHTLGCRGCHSVSGVGGADGPDLTRAGEVDPGQLGFEGVRGERTVENWLKEHFRAPARVVPGSLMPELGLSEGEIEDLTFYMMSLRHGPFPEKLWPKDRIRAERFGEREFATDGATLYGTFCSACHGPRGEGRRYPGLAPFPSVANRDFLAVADDAFIAATVTSGRPGRRMPAWGEQEGGLRPEEIRAVVAHMRALAGVAYEADGRPPRWVRGDPEAGKALFAASCAGCHGPAGEGRDGPALANPVLLRTASDSYLVRTITRGRAGTQMESFARPTPVRRGLSEAEVEAIVTFIRTWEKKP